MCCTPQEVITNKHVVAMMKEAIKETQDMPMFVSANVSSFHEFYFGTFKSCFYQWFGHLLHLKIRRISIIIVPFLPQEAKMTRSRLKQVVGEGVSIFSDMVG